jgi:CubicO group peptidase (beta-lactamase class C family)
MHPSIKAFRTSALVLVAVGVWLAAAAQAQTSPATPAVPADMEARIPALVPDLERLVTTGMQAFDVPGAVVGIVAGDRLVYSKSFGVRRKGGKELVGTKTVFQIGSTTKAFQPDGEGHLTQLRWTNEGQSYLLRERQSP